MGVGIVERAYQLAQSGEFHSIEDVRRQLGREGYDDVHMHISGKHTKVQLMKMLAEAKRADRQ